MTFSSSEELEKRAEISVPLSDPNAVLVDLPIGDYVDCVIHSIQSPTGKMKSAMIHGVSVPDDMPFKMWSGSFLEGVFSRKPDLIGRPLRIRRLEDTDTGEQSKMKTYRLSDLAELKRLLDKDKQSGSDKPSPVKH